MTFEVLHLGGETAKTKTSVCVVMTCLAAGVLLVAPLAAGAAPPYAGSASCTPCHRAQAQSHPATGHAHALAPAVTHRLAATFPLAAAEFRRPTGFRFRFDGFTVRVDDGTDVLAVPMEWAFGSGGQAVTFVSKADGRFYLEHFLTYYKALGAFGPTPGQSALKPGNLAEAAGLLYKVGDARAGIDGCFECHSTGGLGRDLTPAENGVQCEACHGPSAAHVSSAGKAAVTNPRRLGAAGLNEFCGRCHRPPASDPARVDWNFPWNVRHQPVYLSQSACFIKSEGRLSCLTCHAAHEALSHDMASYDARCLGCHAAAHPVACAPRDCAGCHMPRVTPEPPLRFTNHWIGVYGAGAKLKPR